MAKNKTSKKLVFEKNNDKKEGDEIFSFNDSVEADEDEESEE